MVASGATAGAPRSARDPRRHGANLSDNSDASLFDPDSAGEEAVELLKAHVAYADEREMDAVAREIDDAVLDWVDARNRVQQEGKKLLYQSRDQTNA